MPSARHRPAAPVRLLLLAVSLLTVGGIVGGGALPAVARQAPAVVAHAEPSGPADLTPSSSHPYGDPSYFPLRNPVKVSCVYSNCPGSYHGHWAINFIGHMDDPIYAAGAGIFHIGGIAPSCTVSPVTQGTWVWVDHGAGGVTRYMHLSSIVATEGQLVTPGTEIGTMGASGNGNCNTAYVDMEWRAGRLGGDREPIPAMTACVGGTAVSFPSALGYSEWNSMPYNDITTPATTTDCLTSFDQTPARPTVTTTRTADGQLLVVPSARPVGTTAVRVWMEEYHPSLKAYDSIPALRDIPVTQSGTHYSGLVDGRSYRFSVAFENAHGWSAWAPVVTTYPAWVPAAPAYRSLSASSSSISYAWYRTADRGLSPAKYQVARRCKISGVWRAWAYTTVPGSDIHYSWKPARRNTTCEVMVRAHNALGYGPWSTRKFVATHG